MADEREKLHQEIARLRAVEAELTARAVRAEEELQASRALHAATIESLPFDFWARDREGYCFSQNATTLENWGDLLHKRPEDMELPPQVLEAWLDNNRRALSGEIVRGDVEYVIHGATRYFHNVLAPIRMDEGIMGTLGVNLDVTDRKRALQALRESEEKLRTAADIAGLGLWTWDPAVDEVVWEPALSAIFGLPPGTFPTTRDAYSALVHPEDRDRIAARIAAGMASGRWEDEYRVVRTDGAVRWVLVKTRVVRDGDRARVVGAVIDVTERKRRDEQLRQAQKLEAVGQLTAGIAHNFNNMLMGVLPNLELAMRQAPAGLLPLLDGASTAARRAADLVRRLMTYAGRNRPTERTTEEITPLVARAVELCRTTFDKRIVLDQAYEANARARVDATQIEQAILNILINARDALETPDIQEPQVSISVGAVQAGAEELAGRDGDHVRVRIGDNGSGMDAATAARIYEPFFTTKDVGKGTGLGLATTHAIFHEHGGFMTCESAPGNGTVFSLYLPRVSTGTRPNERHAPMDDRPAGGTETVLVIDDEPGIRRVVSVMLEGAGYVVRQAGSGTEALVLLAGSDLASKVSLVLLDVSMPGPPRRELRERLRELTRARVVYFTGYALDAADAHPDDAVLEKPVTEERLLRTVRRILDGS
jgi:PAS domain S-box-containing protein